MPDRLPRPSPLQRPAVSALSTLCTALGGVGAVFVLKYGAEVMPAAGLAALGFGGVYVGAVLTARRLSDSAPTSAVVTLEALLLLGALALAVLSPPESDVVRLPALAVWLERLFDGAYPYGIPVRPSGFPGLFLLAAPFWAAGLLRLLPVVGLAVFLVVLRRYTPTDRLTPLVGLALLPSFYYEVVVHSELFFNSALVLASLGVFEWARRRSTPTLLVAAALAGLLLSTRLYVGVVYAVYGAYAFRSDWGRGAAFAGVALAAWAATWAPFVAWDPERFAAFGPFAVQSLYLPRWLAGLSVGTALWLGWRAPDLDAVVTRAGWLLLTLVAFFGVTAVDRSFPLAMFLGFDVSYLVLPTPFLLAALAGRRLRDEATRGPERELSSVLDARQPTPDPA
jgi:hypothetical protein